MISGYQGKSQYLKIAFLVFIINTIGCAAAGSGINVAGNAAVTGERIAVDGSPNGLYYDSSSGRLFIVDTRNHRLLVRGSDGKIGELCRIEPPPGQRNRVGLGGITADGDGNLFMVSLPFKERKYGAIYRIAVADGTVAELGDIDARWRRVGLTYDEAERKLYVSTFDKLDDPDRKVYKGWVEAVDPQAGGETRIVDGFKKPVGLLKRGNTLLVADQKAGRILTVDISGPEPIVNVLIDNLPEPDLMISSGDDFFFTAFDESTGTGYIFRGDYSGRYKQLMSGPWQPRGIAFDGSRRLFISLHKEQAVMVLEISGD